MSCKIFSISQKDQVIQDTEWMTLALEIFLTAHRMLRSFVDLLRARVPKCCRINYDTFPLCGALEAVGTAMTSIIYRNVPKKELQQLGLFYDIFLCSRCHETQQIPENIAKKVKGIFDCLNETSSIESISSHIKNVLCILENLPSNATSERLRMLFFLLREMMKKVVCCGQLVKESLTDTQSKLLFNVVNELIREWSERKTHSRPSHRICIFCDNVIDEKARHWGTFCCTYAEHLSHVWKEWALRETILVNDRDRSDNEVEAEHVGREKSPDITRDCEKVFITHRKEPKVDGICNRLGDPNVCERKDLYRPKINADVKNSRIDGVYIKETAEFEPTTSRANAMHSVEVEGFSSKSKTDRHGPSSIRSDGELEKFGRDFRNRKNRVLENRGKRDGRRSSSVQRMATYSDATNSQDKHDNIKYRSKGGEVGGRKLYRSLSRGKEEVQINATETRDRRRRKFRNAESDDESDRIDQSERKRRSRSRGKKELKSDAEEYRDRSERKRRSRSRGKKELENYGEEYRDRSERKRRSRSRGKKELENDAEEYRDRSERKRRSRSREKKELESDADEHRQRRSKKYRDEDSDDDRTGKTKRSERKHKSQTQKGRSKKFQDTESNEDRSRRNPSDRSDSDDRDLSRRRKKSRERSSSKDKYEKRTTRVHDSNDEEKTTGRRGKKKVRGDNDESEEMVNISKSKEVRGRRTKKGDALDSERRGASRDADEERKVRKVDGKRKGLSSAEQEGTDDPDLTKKRKGVTRELGTSTEDKSTLDLEGRKTKKRGNKKGSRLLDSSGTVDDDYSKINGSRYHRRKPGVSKLYDVEVGPPNSIEYQLSNEHFAKLGWTMLPVTKTMAKIVQYQAKAAKPHMDWFKNHRYEETFYYNDQVTPFLNFRVDGSGEVFYPNGVPAIKVYKPKNRKYDMYTVFTPGGKDSMGIERKSQITAIFDTIGNGAVFDEDGRTRLSYNQIGGIYADNSTGLPFAWTWNREAKESIVKTVYAEKSVTRLEKFLNFSSGRTMKSSGSVKAPMSTASSRNKEKKVVEQKPVVEEHEEEVESGSEFIQDYPDDSCHIKTICMKLNDYLSLRIIDRRNINLQFMADRNSIRIELGTVLNFNKEVSSFFVDSSLKNPMLKCKFEELFTGTLKSDSSLHDLLKERRKIKRSARQRRAMIAKYRPWARTLKKSITCHS